MKTCFFICPLGKPASPERVRSDQLQKHLLFPVLNEAGYKIQRADQMSHAGFITTQIIKALDDVDLVIADLTGENANVFYELAIRHVTGKPYIQLIEEGATIPFDVRGIRTIHIDLRDLDKVEKSKQELTDQVRGIKFGAVVESPVSAAITENLFTKDSNLTQVFFDKFWAIEERLDQLYNAKKDERSDLVDDIENRLENLIESKIDDMVERISKELKDD